MNSKVFIIVQEMNAVLIQTPEIYGHQFAYTRFLHSYTINYVNAIHGHFVVGNDNELRVVAELLYHLRELTHISIVQRSIYLIEYAERCRLDQVNRK